MPATQWLSSAQPPGRGPLFVAPWAVDYQDCGLPGSSVHGIFQARMLEGDCHFHLQGIFQTQGSNLGLLCLLTGRQILYH